MGARTRRGGLTGCGLILVGFGAFAIGGCAALSIAGRWEAAGWWLLVGGLTMVLGAGWRRA